MTNYPVDDVNPQSVTGHDVMVSGEWYRASRRLMQAIDRDGRQSVRVFLRGGCAFLTTDAVSTQRGGA